VETIKGYVQEQPEMRFTPNGNVFTRIVISDTKDESDITKYKRIVTWGEIAEEANKALIKENFIYAKGYWKTRNWMSEDGENHSLTELVARHIWKDTGKQLPENIMEQELL